MTIHACCLLAMLLAGPTATANPVEAERFDFTEPGFLISRNEVLADVNQVCAVLVTGESSIDYEPLQAQVVEKLRAEGIEHVECQTGVTPRLHVHVEVVSLAGHDLSVYRVQTALSRIVTFTDHRELRVQADVWRLRPVMKAIPDANLSDALTDAVLTQVEVFAGECRAAHRLQETRVSVEEDPSAANPEADQVRFVASRNSSVFHRADCPSVLRIAEGNLVTYATRDKAIAAGKRPCKSCQP
jgi:hypothetical protein